LQIVGIILYSRFLINYYLISVSLVP
jgi:hypothetical protein